MLSGAKHRAERSILWSEASCATQDRAERTILRFAQDARHRMEVFRPSCTSDSLE